MTDYFETRDKARLFYRFSPSANARHTLIMLHGYGEHSGRYEKFLEGLDTESLQLAVMDFRGMGLSEGVKGDIGCFDDYLEDISDFIKHLQKKFSISSRIILFGHSFGGLVALHWAMSHQDCIKTLVISVPFLGLRGRWLAYGTHRIIRCVMPKFVYRNPVLAKGLTHDLQEIASYQSDPRIVREISAHLLGEIIGAMEMIRKKTAVSFSFPVYMFCAGRERIVDPKEMFRFFERLVVPHKEIFRFEGFYHEIFNEIDRQKPFNVLKTIIEDCV